MERGAFTRRRVKIFSFEKMDRLGPRRHFLERLSGSSRRGIGARFENLIPSTVLKTPIAAAGWRERIPGAPRLVSGPEEIRNAHGVSW